MDLERRHPTTAVSSTGPPDEDGDRLTRKPSRSSSYARKAAFWVLVALMVGVATINLPNNGVWLGVKAFALEAVGIILAVFAVSRGEWTRERLRGALAAAPNLAILAFLIWIGISAARSDLPVQSRYEAMRYLGGGLVYFAVVYGLSVRRHLGDFVAALLAAAGLAALFAFINAGETDYQNIAGAFRNNQLLAAFLCLLMPVILMASQADEEPWRKLAGQVAIVVVVAGLLVARNRSAWFGALAALVVVVVLYLRYLRENPVGGLQKHQVVVPVLMVALSLGLFIAMSQTGGMLSTRAQTLIAIARDDSFRWRLGMWDKARRMVAKRPVFGWGIGTFAMQQALFFHPDCPTRMQVEIEYRPTLRENAHNTYLQLAAETGWPGLALYLGIFAAFFATALRALGRVRRGFRQAILVGCIAAVAGQMVSSIGSPAWEFPECSLFLWLILGMGMALSGVGERGLESASERRKSEGHADPGVVRA